MISSDCKLLYNFLQVNTSLNGKNSDCTLSLQERNLNLNTFKNKLNQIKNGLKVSILTNKN